MNKSKPHLVLVHIQVFPLVSEKLMANLGILMKPKESLKLNLTAMNRVRELVITLPTVLRIFFNITCRIGQFTQLKIYSKHIY